MEDNNINRVRKEGRPDIDTTNDAMPPLYTATEIADYLHVSRSTVHRLIEDGSLRGTSIGQALRFTPDNIRELNALESIDRAPNAWVQCRAALHTPGPHAPSLRTVHGRTSKSIGFADNLGAMGPGC